MATDSPRVSVDDSTRRPGRPRNEQRPDSEVADRLLDAATELAVERGFDAAGLREIAARADVSPGMIAYYFGDRQGLSDAMFKRAIDRVGGKVLAILEDTERGGDDRLDELVRIHVETIASDPWLPQLIIREVLAKTHTSLKDELATSVGGGPMQLMIDWIKEEQARGILTSDLDPAMVAMTIASMTVFPYMMMPIVGQEIGVRDDDDFAARLISHNQRLLARGIRARKEHR